MDERDGSSVTPGPDPKGLGPDARLLYAALITQAGDLAGARESLDPSVDVDEALALLTRLHLLHRGGADDRYSPVSPAEAAEDLLGPGEARAHASLTDAARMRRSLRDLEPLYRKATRQHISSSSAELLHDGEEVRARLEEIRDGVTTSISSAHPTMAPAGVLNAALDSDAELMSRGIVFRELFTHTALRYHSSLTYVRAMRRLGAQVRTASMIPSRLILIDDTYALIPTPGLASTAALVRDEAMIGFLHQMFEFLWERAQEVSSGEASAVEVPHEIEVAILHEMSEGRTDEAIARRLGISSRTLRRYLAGMLETFGVETRFQLGVAATRSGLVGSAPQAPDLE
ncbi:MAG: LuxR family transcriptional regulator [Humibacillus sp.]|nr:LuxR family transcriptional regulator [Humibacillus sp.]